MSDFFNYLKAGYPVLWVETHEEDRAISTLQGQASMYDAYSWDIIDGLKDHQTNQINDNASDPMAPLTIFQESPETSVLFLKDYHKFITGVDIYRTLKNMIPKLKQEDKHIICVSPVTNIPIELEKDITLLPFDLPSAKELLAIANQIVRDNDLSIEVDEQVIKTSKGLTFHEAENAMALSLVKHKNFSRNVLEQEKLQAIKKSGLLELYPPVPESEFGGYDTMRTYIHNRKVGFEDPLKPTPKGILLVGFPGAGKSLASKVIAHVLGFPLIKFDFGALKGSLVGQSEQNLRTATKIIDAVGNCVVWMDEIEKAVGGVQSSNRTDGGTSSGMFGNFLTWYQESSVPKYFVATCNEIDDLLAISQGALLRRFDDIFFLDVPNESERRDILEIMNARYNTELSLDLTQRMKNWTGAEIEKFVVASIYDGIDDALNNTHPIFEQNKDLMTRARDWAKVNARFANSAEDKTETNKKVRRLHV